MTAPGAAPDEPVETPRAAASSRTAGASALWRDVAGGTAADPGFVWALVVGMGLVVLGLLGFVPNPIVGSPSAAWGTPLLLTGDAHDVLHLVGGAVALHAALGMSRAHRDVVLIGLGAAALILLALGLLDGRWLGIAPFHVGLSDQLLHLIVGVGSLVTGLAGTGTINVPVVTGAYRRSELGLGGGSAGADAVEAPTPESPEPASEPVEAMPEPLGLELDEPGAVPEPDGEPEAAAELDHLADPEPPKATVAELEPPAEPESGVDTEPPAKAAEPGLDGEPGTEAAAREEPSTQQDADTH
jgi:hypothetical protein